MTYIELNTSNEQKEMIEKYKNDTNIKEKMLNYIMGLIQEIEDIKAVEKSIELSKGKPTYSLKEVCEMSGIDYETL